MKDSKRTQPKDKNQDGRTNVPGQNPKQNDSPSHDEHNDQNRVNQYGKKSAS